MRALHTLPALALAALVVVAPARADQVIADDLVVKGQGDCVGFDCTVGDTWTFGSVRTKENNLRIHFDDTSDPLVGPANDWRITANDSASGGFNYLRIEDGTTGFSPFRVDGAAPTDSLVVASSGAVGIGTDAPAARLHAVGSVRVNGDLLARGSVESGLVPATALVKRVGSVTFAAPAPGDYAIALSPVGATPKAKLEVFLISRDANGFTFSVAGNLENLAAVAWTTRPVGEN
jgi:hypothetical protein